jgi:hypothetical protein
MDIPNIKYTGDYSRYIENNENSKECVSFYKDREYFSDIANYNKFVKSCEDRVRHYIDYDKFIIYIKNVIGLNFCQVSSNIFDTDATIEMHHGPIFTLYDYVSIILNKLIESGERITTFKVADLVIQEHYELRVQIVMVSITRHEAITNRDIFVNLKQGFGNIGEFIKLYSPYFTDDQKYKIYRYIEACKENESFDNGVLDIDNVEKFVKL